MKKIIRFLANISGVEDDIRKDERINVGSTMDGARYWWSGGSDGLPKYDVYNAFLLYSRYLKNGYLNPPIDTIRKEVYSFEKNRYMEG